MKYAMALAVVVVVAMSGRSVWAADSKGGSGVGGVGGTLMATKDTGVPAGVSGAYGFTARTPGGRMTTAGIGIGGSGTVVEASTALGYKKTGTGGMGGSASQAIGGKSTISSARGEPTAAGNVGGLGR